MKLLTLLSIIILSYDPAPGQFINTLPAVTDDPHTSAQTAIDRGMMVCLGAAGGSLTATFTEPVTNSHDYDITIYGNAFEGSSEPGIVFVSKDVNHNGKADDPWYEIAGSEYARTIHDYSITYYRPASDTSDIRYTDSEGNTGHILRNTFHTQPYYPTWTTADSLTFHGALLPSNVTIEENKISFASYSYGYADNLPNSDDEACSIKIDWAVDSLGNSAKLDTIHFIRIQTGVLFTDSRQTGEQSTEISAINSIHQIDAVENLTTSTDAPTITTTEIIFPSPLQTQVRLYELSGCLVKVIPCGTEQYSISDLPKNTIYLLRCADFTYKFVR